MQFFDRYTSAVTHCTYVAISTFTKSF